MSITNIATGIICIFLGIVLYVGKTTNMIAGYNTMPEEEQAKYDADKLSRFAGRQCLLLGFIMVISGAVMLLYPKEWVGYIAWGLFLVVIIAGLIYSNTNKRFLKSQHK